MLTGSATATPPVSSTAARQSPSIKRLMSQADVDGALVGERIAEGGFLRRDGSLSGAVIAEGSGHWGANAQVPSPSTWALFAEPQTVGSP